MWVEVSPSFNTSDPLENVDVWDGETVETNLTRGMIATKLIMDKPNKIRFPLTSLSPSDIEKLTALALANSYSTIVDDKWISFLSVSTPNETDPHD